MNNFIKDIFISILTSGAVVAFFTLVLRKTIEKWIDNIFLRHLEQFKHENQKRLEELKHENDAKLTQLEAQLNYLEHKAVFADKQRLSGFKDLATTAYRSKNHMQQIVNKLNSINNATEEDCKKTVSEIVADVSNLHKVYSEHLYRLILFIEKPLFDKLHAYKDIIGDIKKCLMLLQEDSNQLNNCRKRIDNLVSTFIKAHTELIESLQKSLGLDIVIGLPDH